MSKCDVCSKELDESELTTVTPSRYLGGEYSSKTAFCPVCFVKFTRKAKKIMQDQEVEKLKKLKVFTDD